MEHPASYRNRRVIVLGLARSGVSVAKVFHALGANVIVNDMKERELSPEAGELEALGVTVICGYHPEDLVTADTALLVKNPGIPYTASPIKQAEALEIEIVTEVEVAYLLSPAPIIGITGSNGKTTTTTWIGELLQAAGMKPIVAGNIGTPLCEAAQEADAGHTLVAELSSFQLKGTTSFRPHVALLLNVVETHLDYHGGMEDYVASKAKLFANQTADDIAVLNWDDAICRTIAEQLNSQLLPFSLTQRLDKGLYIEPPYEIEPEQPEGNARSAAEDTAFEGSSHTPVRHVVYRDAQGVTTSIIPVDELGIPGKHNAANAMAAIAAAIASGASIAKLQEPLREFRGVEHRLEYVCERNGVTYYNNSKATNPAATIVGLKSFPLDRIILIAGGLDRGSDYMELLPWFAQLKAAVTLGETRGKLAHVAQLAGLTAVETVEPEGDAEATLQEAVRRASALAESGDVVLLSPACASWDMFKSYEQRGRIFKQSAHTL
ncbi:UDP-N-acetylmuramoyl-L-alanine--D-glutamate ligase [Paenibacillus sp. MMS18-CY102]|uniref:UDP-N-acetylmuramoyl-L-alanine--D-glutamate ligase n=1 Tax=Paenibacillus sp. MMS18-CY102 TaxID=2682849 RepID=UPI00136623B9|nr:UDP-N-acetylmuramoyl-L-alanine--D-glutamate ligase [Paenibacillus sp. MMS18-CY102]MWC27443.1 UDP-N-acetylmuramoyl-L-alanine--D-glutamate ligase [Paenibacillus sp. MMS18-CY102]